MSKFMAVVLAILVSSLQLISAADWPEFLGPDGCRISQEKDWSPDALKKPKILWKKNVGHGYSAVSVKDGLLYTMGFNGGNDIVTCLKADTGEKVWEKTYPCSKGKRYPGPRCTPTISDGAVYTLSRQGHLLCMSVKDGSVKWKKNIVKELKAGIPHWGLASSVRIVGNLAVVNAGACGMAFDKKSGRKIWSGGGGKSSYSTPVIIKKGATVYAILFPVSGPAMVRLKDGKKLWSYPWKTKYDVNAADPLLIGKNVFVSSGYNTGCVMLNISTGKPKKLWQNRNMSAHFTSPVEIDGYIYGVSGNTSGGKLTCIEARTGKVKWSEHRGAESFMVADNKLIVIDKDGTLLIVKAQPSKYTVLAQANVINQSAKYWTMPVLCNGKIYCRNSLGTLVCVDVKK